MHKHMNLMLAATVAAFCLTPARAQMRDNQEKTLNCDHNNHEGRLVTHCEISEQAMSPSGGVIDIDPGGNGGITVKGWSKAQVLVRSRIDTAAGSDAEARALAGQIRLSSGAAHIHAEGPSAGPEADHDRHWSVSYEIFVPWQSDIRAATHNGGIHIQDVRGTLHFQTKNGGVTLARLAGDVQGRTTNGGLKVELIGDKWDGQGMNVETVNGGVRVAMPSNYSAHVETATTNGGISTDFPVSVQGKISNSLSFNVGGGGATIRVVTTNGGVKIQRS